ncbi:hypothetical protein C5167_004808 [Papaver somniferum]|uniref:Uncharacterized protein n=1 Tax=Papaver somniferum TaxID=3469 RepID=A0A4Y7JAH5_PAPSO|nr:hypothetical protein C5167_004808 [Papaver somniferum]
MVREYIAIFVGRIFIALPAELIFSRLYTQGCCFLLHRLINSIKATSVSMKEVTQNHEVVMQAQKIDQKHQLQKQKR